MVDCSQNAASHWTKHCQVMSACSETDWHPTLQEIFHINSWLVDRES